MRNKLIFLFVILSSWSYVYGSDFNDLIDAALASDNKLKAAQASYSSVLAGAAAENLSTLPGLSFTTDSNNPLYKYSLGEDYYSYPVERKRKHTAGAGLALDTLLPGGGLLNLSGSGSLIISSPADDEELSYFMSPSAGLYFRQPLFTDRSSKSMIRFDSIKLARELNVLSVNSESRSVLNTENALVISVYSAVVKALSIEMSLEIIEQRIAISADSLKLAAEDEASGKISRLDFIAEELSLRRLEDISRELLYQYEAALRDIKNITGSELVKMPVLPLIEADRTVLAELEAALFSGSVQVQAASELKRILEIQSAIFPDGTEPVFEVTALINPGSTDPAEDISEAYDNLGEAELNTQLTVALSFGLIDWGENKKRRESDKAEIEAARYLFEDALRQVSLSFEGGLDSIKNIDRQLELIETELVYDLDLLEREKSRQEAGLSTSLAVKAVELDYNEQLNQKEMLLNQRTLAVLTLYNIAGRRLAELF